MKGTYFRACFHTVMVAGWAWFGINAAELSQSTTGQKRAADTKLMQEVTAGKRTEARAAWWGFDPVEATPMLQAAINSGARKVIIENMGTPWVVDKIQLASNQEIVFEPDVVVQAKRGAYHGLSDALFSAVSKTNFALTGPGATLKMWKEDYTGPDYAKSEWRNVITLASCENVRLTGLTLADSGGDGVYLGAAQPDRPNRNVEIREVTFSNNHRQGISVISAENLLIERCALLNTAGTAPQAGIDFEPNHPSERLVNCVLRDCRSEGNRGPAFDFYFGQLQRNSIPVSIRLERCSSKGGPHSVSLATLNDESKAVTGFIEFVHCRFDDAEREAIEIGRKPAKGCRVRFENCVISNPAASHEKLAPIQFAGGNLDSEDIGGVEFKQCTVMDRVSRRPISYHDNQNGLRLTDVTGNLKVVNAGKTTAYELNDDLLKGWFPALALRRFPKWKLAQDKLGPAARPNETKEWRIQARARGEANWLMWAETGQKPSFMVRLQSVGKNEAHAIPLRCVSPSGKEVGLTPEPGAATEMVFSFPAAETGAYRIHCEPGNFTAELAKASAPVCLLGEGGHLHLLSTTGDFYFWVPKDATAFAIKLAGENSAERVQATLFDSQNQLVQHQDNIAETVQLLVDLPSPSGGQVWRLKLDRPSSAIMEDYFVDLQGVPPLLAGSPEALLRTP